MRSHCESCCERTLEPYLPSGSTVLSLLAFLNDDRVTKYVPDSYIGTVGGLYNHQHNGPIFLMWLRHQIPQMYLQNDIGSRLSP